MMTQHTMPVHLTTTVLALALVSLLNLIAPPSSTYYVAGLQAQKANNIGSNIQQQPQPQPQVLVAKTQNQDQLKQQRPSANQSPSQPLVSKSRQLYREYVIRGDRVPTGWVKVPRDLNGFPLCQSRCFVINGETYQMPNENGHEQMSGMVQMQPAGQPPFVPVSMEPKKNDNDVDDDDKDDDDDDDNDNKPKGTLSATSNEPNNNNYGQQQSADGSGKVDDPNKQQKSTHKPAEGFSIARILKGFGGGMLGR